MSFTKIFLDKAQERLETASPDMRRECFAILCVEAGGYVATGEMIEVDLRNGLLDLAEKYDIPNAKSTLIERFQIGQKLPRHWPEFQEHTITVTRKEDKYVFFNAECECGDPRHTMHVTVSKKNYPYEGAEAASIITHCSWHDSYDSENFWTSAWNRIKAACKVLFLGELEVEGEFLFRKKEDLRAFASILEAAADHVEEKSSNKR